jgi:hypothetical protein
MTGRRIAVPRSIALGDDEMARIGSATRLDSNLTSAPTALRLTGDVGPVLRSTCAWVPEQSGTAAGNIRAIDVFPEIPCSGLGVSAFGSPPERAVQRLGEFVMIEGASWWTPAMVPTQSRAEPPGTLILTPFLVYWDHMVSASAALRSSSPVPLVHWYEYLLQQLAYRGICETGVIAVRIIANMPARLIADKHLVRAPLREAQPRDGQLITDNKHLDEYFLTNAAARAHGDDTWCTVIMVGVAVDPAAAGDVRKREFIQRGFYTMPGAVRTSAIMHHTHALVTRQVPAPGAGGEEAGDVAGRLRHITREWVAGARTVQVVHIENDTLLHHADACIGTISTMDMD